MPTTTANPQQTGPAGPSAQHAGDVLQEYADNRGVQLRVDRLKGIIPGVKLLGTVSRKGRVYPKEVIEKALPLYEGMRVNVDHVDPGQRRSLRDRIGLVKNVTLKEDGLFGDFHFNPEHALANQIAWDAENAPQNLGFSHDSRGGSRNVGGKVVVESIDKVLSVDLVANPATTTGLFEDETESESNYQLHPQTQESEEMELKDLTLDQLKSGRPDLVTSLQESLEKGDELKTLQEELKTLKAEKAARLLQESIAADLKAAGLDPANKTQCSQVFMEDLAATADTAKRKAKIDDRKALVGAKPAGSYSAASTVPVSSAPLQEGDAGPAIPPATAPLPERIKRFAK